MWDARKNATVTGDVRQLDRAPRFLIVDDDDDVREMMGALVEELCSCDWLGAKSLEEIEALGPAALQCSLALIDMNLGAGEPNGAEAYAWLLAHGYRGETIFVTGREKDDPAVRPFLDRHDVEVMQKPVPFDALVERLNRARERRG